MRAVERLSVVRVKGFLGPADKLCMERATAQRDLAHRCERLIGHMCSLVEAGIGANGEVGLLDFQTILDLRNNKCVFVWTLIERPGSSSSRKERAPAPMAAAVAGTAPSRTALPTQALEHFRKAQEHLKRWDWTGFGEETPAARGDPQEPRAAVQAPVTSQVVLGWWGWSDGRAWWAAKGGPYGVLRQDLGLRAHMHRRRRSDRRLSSA